MSRSRLDWAQRQGGKPVDQASIDPMVVQYPSAPQMDTQLWALLISLCDIGSEALALVKNIDTSFGLDAWRRLTTKVDPDNPQANRQLTRRILGYQWVS